MPQHTARDVSKTSKFQKVKIKQKKNDGIYHSWIESTKKKVSVKLIGNGPKNTSKLSAGPGDFSSDFLGFPPAGFVAVGAWKASNSWALKDVLVSYDRNSSMGKCHGLQGGRLRIDPLFIYLFYISSNWDMLICYSLSKSTSTTREIHHLPWFFRLQLLPQLIGQRCLQLFNHLTGTFADGICRGHYITNPNSARHYQEGIPQNYHRFA